MNAEICRDPLDRPTGLTVAGNAYDIITELARVRLRHDGILPGHPPGLMQVQKTSSIQMDEDD